jgi:hypothetical protein
MSKYIYFVLLLVLLGLQFLTLAHLVMANEPIVGWMMVAQGLMFLVQAARAYLFSRRYPDLDLGDRQTASATVHEDADLGIGA